MSWIHGFIDKELSRYKQRHISIEELRKRLNSPLGEEEVLISIRGKRIEYETKERYIPCFRMLNPIIESLRRVVRDRPSINMDFILCWSDEIPEYDYYPEIPIFGFCKKKNRRGVLIPDNPIDFILLKSKMDSEECVWINKIPKAYFLGSTSFPEEYFLGEDLFKQPRANLVLKSMQYPELIDAKFVDFLARPEERESETKKFIRHFQIHPTSSQKEINNYKYAIDADGRTNGWTRCRYILSSNTVSIKHSTPYHQWFYPEMQAGVHYIEVKRDFSDLREKVLWAEKNPLKCQEMIENASKFADGNLTAEKQLEYLYQVILKYSKRFENYAHS